jgi:hypothetical protein
VSCRASEEDEEEEEGLLFIPQVIYKHEEPRRSDTDRIKLLIRPPELSVNHTSKSSGSKKEERAKGMIDLALGNTFYICELF